MLWKLVTWEAAEAVGEAEKQTEEEKTLRHSLEQRLRSALLTVKFRGI